MDLSRPWPYIAGQHAFVTGGSRTALIKAEYLSGWLSAEHEAIADGFGFARVDSLKPNDSLLLVLRKRLVRTTLKSIKPTKTGLGQMMLHFADLSVMSIRRRDAIVLVKRPEPHAALVKRYEARKAERLAKQQAKERT